MMGDYEPPSYCPGTFKACTVAGVAEVADGYPDLALFVGAKARGVALLSSRLLVLDPGAIACITAAAVLKMVIPR